jgi:DNA-binding Xre family transcriptional regulator
MLALKLAEYQEHIHLAQVKINETEKRSIVFMRERDLAMLEHGRTLAAKSKLENLCRELHRNIQLIRVNNLPSLLLN